YGKTNKDIEKGKRSVVEPEIPKERSSIKWLSTKQSIRAKRYIYDSSDSKENKKNTKSLRAGNNTRKPLRSIENKCAIGSNKIVLMEKKRNKKNKRVN
ncbi:27745_t:CDS:1, partial [Dentiscutata erythropus]